MGRAMLSRAEPRSRGSRPFGLQSLARDLVLFIPPRSEFITRIFINRDCFITLPKVRTTYGNGREARPLDIVQGNIGYEENPKNPFIGQIIGVIPEIGAAKIALVRRPEVMARRLPHFALQNLAADACGLEFRPLSELTLRHRASRPVANSLRHGATSENTRRQYGCLAAEFGKRQLPLQVCRSAAGFYLGTKENDQPFSRESVEYWRTREEANEALLSPKKWSQRPAP